MCEVYDKIFVFFAILILLTAYVAGCVALYRWFSNPRDVFRRREWDD